MKTKDKEKILAEIDRIIQEETPISKGSYYFHGVVESMDKLRSFINSMPVESPKKRTTTKMTQREYHQESSVYDGPEGYWDNR